MYRLFCCFIVLLPCCSANAQAVLDTATGKDKALRVFLDCNSCDFEYLKSDLTYINYVRDRIDAQVDVVISSLGTGSGGTEYTLVFMGQKEFAGESDTLKFDASSFETDDGVRKKTEQVLKLGLVRYIAKTPYASELSVSYDGDTSKTQEVVPKDKWRSWVFSSNVFGYVNAQESTKYTFLSPSLSASKVTPGWKISIGANATYSDNYFITSDTTIKSFSKSEQASCLYVKSISQHFSWGINSSMSTSTFSNIKLSETISPGFEYSVFPYSQATHRLFRFLYYIYGVNTQYIDTTIFGKTNNRLLGESLTASLNYKEPWGSLYISLIGSHYFYDFSKNNFSFSTSLNLNLFEGFTLNISGSASLVHDQLFLPANGATTDEILLQVRTLATSYYYYSSVGITYTFGSIYNNVVNPRFNGGGY